ncbi:MAG: aldolase [Opitutaceae bacterium]|nr:aldolase [Opitutaceae bacterium]
MTTLRSSRIKRLLREGKFPATFKSNLTDPRVTEILGACGFDGIWLCNEHVPNDWITLEHTIRAARLHDMDTLVRIAKGGYSDYIRPLEAGATGIIVPHVESAGEAEKIVSWTRFHPLGKRALDGGNTDGLYCIVPQDEYIENSNTEKLIILQIESPEGLEQVEKIAAVPGFDGFLFGPGDFSHRIGKAGQLTAPELNVARQRVAQAARANGKFAMTSGLFIPFDQFVAEGTNVFNLGSDVGALQVFSLDRLKLMQGHVAALPAAAKTTNPYA